MNDNLILPVYRILPGNSGIKSKDPDFRNYAALLVKAMSGYFMEPQEVVGYVEKTKEYDD